MSVRWSLLVGIFVAGTLSAQTGLGIIVDQGNDNDYDKAGNIYIQAISNGNLGAKTGTLARNGFCPRFSPDGTKFAYTSGGNTVTIRDLHGNEINSFSCSGEWLSWTKNGIWTYKTKSKRFIQYDPSDGSTIRTEEVDKQLLQGHVSYNEATASGFDWVGKTEAWAYHFDDGNKRVHIGSGWSCGVHPSPDGKLVSKNNGSHTSMAIYDRNGSKKRDLSISDWNNNHARAWNRQLWSGNSKDILLIPAGTPGKQLTSSALPWIYDLGSNRATCLHSNPGADVFLYIYDFYEGGSLGPVPPAIDLDGSSLSFSADAGGGNPSSQTIQVSNGGGGTLPSLSVSGAPSWLDVSVQGSGNNQELVNSVDIAGLDGGEYTATLTVGGSDVSDVSYSVELTVVAPAVLTSIEITPGAATVAPGGTVQFTARGKDQYGNDFDAGSVSWSVSGGGQIDGGLFSAGSDEGGPYDVSASAGGKSATATVTVSVAPPIHLKVNCGGGATGEWESASGYVSGGSDFSFGGTHDLSGVTNPAPNEVYQTVRHENHSYDFADIPDGSYTVRIHFTDKYDTDGTERAMDYTIEGVKVLDDFNIVATAGATMTAVVREFAVSVADGNGMQIECSEDQGGDVFESGIEIIAGGSVSPPTPSVELLSPGGGETYSVGDEMTISWRGKDGYDGGVYLSLSVDGGMNWYSLAEDAIPTTTGTETFTWTVGDLTGEGGAAVSPVSSTVIVKIEDYMHPTDYMDLSGSFEIQGGATVVDNLAAARQATGASVVAGVVRISVGHRGAHRVSVVRPDGRIVARFSGERPARYSWNPATAAPAVYLISIEAAGGRQVTLVKGGSMR